MPKYLKKHLGGRIFCALLGLYFFYSGSVDLNDGTANSKYNSYSKSESPTAFNLMVSKYFLIGGVLVLIAFSPLRESDDEES